MIVERSGRRECLSFHYSVVGGASECLFYLLGNALSRVDGEVLTRFEGFGRLLSNVADGSAPFSAYFECFSFLSLRNSASQVRC